MYEHFRNDILVELTNRFSPQQLQQICNALDKVSQNYAIGERVTALTVVGDEILYLLKAFIASKSIEGLSKATLEGYFNIIRMFFESVGIYPKDVQVNDIRYYLFQYQNQHNVSNRTLDKYRQILNNFFEWCVNEEYLTRNPCRNIKEFKYEVKPRHPLSRIELEMVRRSCRTKRDLAIVDVLYSTGCRVTELVNMKMSDVDTQNNSIHIIGKGRKHNTVYLNTNAQISLSDYLKDRDYYSEYLFTSLREPHNPLSSRSVEHVLHEIGEELGIELYPHKIRHTTATNALQSGMEITQVQKMLGHSSVATTQIYAETSQDDVAISHKKYVL